MDLSNSASKDYDESVKVQNVVDLSNLPDSDLESNSYPSGNEENGSEMGTLTVTFIEIESPGEPNAPTIENVVPPPSRNMNMITKEARIIPPDPCEFPLQLKRGRVQIIITIKRLDILHQRPNEKTS